MPPDPGDQLDGCDMAHDLPPTLERDVRAYVRFAGLVEGLSRPVRLIVLHRLTERFGDA